MVRTKTYKPYNHLTFRAIGGKTILDSPAPPIFLISNRLIEMDCVECRPINPWSFLIAFCQNCWRYWYWRFLRLLLKIRFINKPAMGEMFSWRQHFKLFRIFAKPGTF